MFWPSFANATCHPDAKQTVCGDIASELASQDIDANTYVLIVTRGRVT